MKFSLIVGGTQVISGDIGVTILVLVLLLAVICVIIVYVVRRLRYNEKIKYEFITIVAHKFRTPLTHIKWLCDTLASDELDSFKKQSVEDIAASNQKLIDLTGTLIEMVDAQTESASDYAIERLPVCEIVRQAATAFKDAFHEKNIFFGVTCPEEEVYVKADHLRLDFAVRTLIENSFTYTPPGKNVEISVTYSSSKVMVSVKDNGIGIAKHDLSNIFLKFFRAENARRTDTEGFGVGLYLSRSIAKRLGGNIEAYSEGENRGSTFTLTLPRVR